jgi:hypothetical protein
MKFPLLFIINSPHQKSTAVLLRQIRPYLEIFFVFFFKSVCPSSVEGVNSCGKGIYKTKSAAAAAYGGVVVRIMAGRWTVQLNKDLKPWQGLHSTYSQNFGCVRDGGEDEHEVQKI